MTAPAAWRHSLESLGIRWCMGPGPNIGYCACQRPEPDPASPCGYVGCAQDHWVRGFEGIHDMDVGDHPTQPTLCLRCHHPIVKEETP